MNINEFDFAKANEDIGQNEIKDHKFYRVHGVTYAMSHGDIEDYDRILLIAAPSAAHAQVWAEMHYLIGSKFDTHQELKETLAENVVDEEKSQYSSFRFIGCIDIGDYKYRCIDNVKEITKEYAHLMYEHDDFYDTNISANAFS